MAHQLFRTAFSRYNGGAAALAASTAAGLSFASARRSAACDDEILHAPSYPWEHLGLLASYDCAALRRGFQVYRQVCATCHSIERIHYRELVGVTHTTAELQEMASEADVLDGPNDEGEMFERPAKLADPLPRPYQNEEQGRLANGGALPPDLSLMVKARHSGQDYLFSLLTGYQEAPAGKEVLPGLYYNPYFPGGAIAMPPPLNDDGVEYEDGTKATISQQARDVVQFLNWCAEPEADTRKRDAFTYMMVIGFCMLVTGYHKRLRWSTLKTRSISYVGPEARLGPGA